MMDVNVAAAAATNETEEFKKIGAKKPPSRLQKHAPASLQLGAFDGSRSWEKGDLARTAIPLLSPLIVSPSPPLWDGEGGGGADHKDAGKDEEISPPPQLNGWRHPALPAVVMEPVSLVPILQSQCTLVHNVL